MKTYNIVEAEVTYSKGNSFIIEWVAESVGFGMLSCWVVDGHLAVDSECMSHNFVESVLRKAFPDGSDWPISNIVVVH